MRRRDFLKAGALLPLTLSATPAHAATKRQAWAAIGDVSGDRATVIVGGLDEGEQLRLHWKVDFSNINLVLGTRASRATDYTARAELTGLPPASNVRFQVRSEYYNRHTFGSFRTPPTKKSDLVRFTWGGDVCGQGYGIDTSRGGMETFRSMLEQKPDFFIHSGDTIYADDPIDPEKRLDDGTIWRNRTIPEKSRPAKSLSDFHGNHRYNFLDFHYREFFRQVPVIPQWDDHEVLNNWEPVKHRDLASKGLRAFLDYWPLRRNQGQLYRRLPYGPNLEVFVLDLRSHRAPNSENRQPESGPETVLLGNAQVQWLKSALQSSKATWKVIAAEMPLSTHTPAWGLDNWANGEGPPLGRELELADILGFLKAEKIRNVVWLSADVHFAAAINFDPERAAHKDFDPFWEFIAGPLHAGTFAPAAPLDPTFGPEMKYCAVPLDLKPNRPPSDNYQFFGKVEVEGPQLRVSLHQRQGQELYKVVLKAH